MQQSWRGVMAGLRHRKRRWAHVVRRWGPVVFVTAGLGVLQASHGHAPLAADALPLFAVAGVWRWWWGGDEGLPGALRLRRRSRMIAVRTATLPALGATVALAVAAAAHGAAHGPLQLALWLAVAAPVPVLADQVLWRLLAPDALRRDARLGSLVEELQELNSGPSHLRPLTFDPSLGAAGRVVPERSLPRPDGLGEPCKALPDRQVMQRMVGQRQLGLAEERWLVNASLVWNGTALVATSLTGQKVGAPPGPGAYSLPGEPVELVWVVEQRDSRETASLNGDRPARGALVRRPTLVLLDDQDRRLLTMSGLGLDQQEVERVAVAAGLAFSAYVLRLHIEKEFGERGLLTLMFPRAPGHVRFHIPFE